MKKLFSFLLTFSLLGMLLVTGCPTPTDDSPPKPAPVEPEPEPPAEESVNKDTVAALAEYFGKTNIVITVGVTGTTTAATLTAAPFNTRSSIIPNFSFTGSLSYTARVVDEETGVETQAPKIDYRISANNADTYDKINFNDIDGKALAPVFFDNIRSLTSAHPNADDGYAYIKEVTWLITEWPAYTPAGDLILRVKLGQDPIAEAVKTSLVVDAVTIDGAAAAGIGGFPAAYNEGSKTLTVTVSAAEVTPGGAKGIAGIIAAAITGKITNNVNPGFTALGGVSTVVENGNVIVTIPLIQPAAAAAPITTAVNAVPNASTLTISGGAASGPVVEALKGIVNATGEDVTAVYAGQTLTVIIPPAEGLVFSAEEGVYSAVGTGLQTKISAGTIVNDDEPEYKVIDSVTTSVSDGSLIVTLVLKNYVSAATITTGITGVANNSGVTISDASVVTGAVITALENISGATGAVSTAYSAESHAFTLTIDPAAGYEFNPALGGNSPYNGLIGTTGTTIRTKIGTGDNVTNNIEAAYKAISSGGVQIINGKMQIVFSLRLAYVAAPAIANAAQVTSVANNSSLTVASANSVTGDIITALDSIPDGTGAILSTVYTTGNHQIVITIAPPAGFAYNSAANTYSTVVTAINNKIGTTLANEVEPYYTGRGTTAISIGGVNMIVTIPLTAAPIPVDLVKPVIDGFEGSGDLTVASLTSITGELINALKNIPDATASVGTSYILGTHSMRIAILPVSGRAWGTAATYNPLAASLKAKLGTITNSLEPGYYVIPATIANPAVDNGSLVFTIALSQTLVTASTIIDVVNAVTDGDITVASASSVTGAAIAALRNIAGATSNVGIGYNQTDHRVTLTVMPATGFSFNTANNAYSGIATALQTLLRGGAVTNNVEPVYSLAANTTVTASVVNGNLSVVIQLAAPQVQAATLGAAVTNADDGNITVSGAASVAGAVITALTGLANGTGPVVATTYNADTHRAIITLQPPSGFVFITTANAYNTFITALQDKLRTGTIDNGVQSVYNKAINTTVTAALDIDLNLVLTIQLAAETVTAATLTGVVNDTADGDITIAGISSISGALIAALTNVENGSGAVATAYSAATHAATVTLSPPTGMAFIETANAYNTIAAAIQAKLNGGTIINAIESAKVKANSVSAAVVSGNLVFTLAMVQHVDSDTLIAAINGVGNSNITVTPAGFFGGTLTIEGAVITALTNLADATGEVTKDWAGNNVTITCTPASAAGFAFNAVAGAYSAVADALLTKLGTGIVAVNTVDFWGAADGTFATRGASNVTAAVTNGNLVLTIATVAQ